jgi:hypothetical protein
LPTSRAPYRARIIHTCVSSIVVSDDVSGRVVAWNAMSLPSGDHFGSYSALFVSVIRRTDPSATFTANTS